MLDIYVFYLVAAFTILSAIAIVAQKRLVYAVGAITMVFVGSAMIFVLLGQMLIAILQLLVFVGGLSTYLIVAVATEEKNARLVKLPVFGAITILLFIGLSLLLGYVPATSAPTAVPNFLSDAASAFTSSYPILYILVILLFSVAISGVLIIKKFTKLIV